MRLHVEEDPELEDIEVLIRCPRIDARVERIAGAAEMEGRRFAAIDGGFLRVLDPADVLYVEHVDGKAFLYVEDAVLESSQSLGDIERDMAGAGFARASRTMLVNLMHVTGMRPYMGARLEMLLDNGEHVIASRQFAPSIKQRIGLQRLRKPRGKDAR